MWELKIHVILHLIQIYFLTKYLVENAENSISGTLYFKIINFQGKHAPRTPLAAGAFGPRFCKHHLKKYQSVTGDQSMTSDLWPVTCDLWPVTSDQWPIF